MAWTRGQTIGRGSTATVSIATNNHSGKIVAVKSSKLSQSQPLVNEQEILSSLKNPCPQIVTYIGCDITNEDNIPMYNLLFEYAPCGTLADAVRNHGGSLDEARIRFYTKEILLGLDYLHANGIVHCDIKGENILVTDDGVKIADLGCAKRVNSGKIGGTPVYMAPEVARGDQQGFAADIWALGCTIIEMAMGRFSSWGEELGDPVSALYRIGFSGDSPEIPWILSKQAQNFLRMCLNVDATERLSASELLEHEFVKGEEQKFVLKESDRFIVITPTSVLNEGLWREYVEESHGSCSSNYRIRQLISEDCSSSSDSSISTWESNESWITVRDNISNSGSSGGGGRGDTICGGEECELDIVIHFDHTNIRETYMCSTSHNVDESLWKENVLLKCTKQIYVELINNYDLSKNLSTLLTFLHIVIVHKMRVFLIFKL